MERSHKYCMEKCYTTFIWQALNNYELKLEIQEKIDFIHASDIVNGLILCAVNGKEGKVYNLDWKGN